MFGLRRLGVAVFLFALIAAGCAMRSDRPVPLGATSTAVTADLPSRIADLKNKHDDHYDGVPNDGVCSSYATPPYPGQCFNPGDHEVLGGRFASDMYDPTCKPSEANGSGATCIDTATVLGENLGAGMSASVRYSNGSSSRCDIRQADCQLYISIAVQNGVPDGRGYFIKVKGCFAIYIPDGDRCETNTYSWDIQQSCENRGSTTPCPVITPTIEPTASAAPPICPGSLRDSSESGRRQRDSEGEYCLPRPTPSPSGVCYLTSQTVATGPGSRARTTIGVGEVVNVTAHNAQSPMITIGNNTYDYSPVTLIAPGTPEQILVGLSDGSNPSCSSSLQFDSIAPNGEAFVRKPELGFEHTNGGYDAGMYLDVYLEPDNVNFSHVLTHEDDETATCTGYYATHCVSVTNGAGYAPATSLVFKRLGTKMNLQYDYAQLGGPAPSQSPGASPSPAPSDGLITVDIPVEYETDNDPNFSSTVFTTVRGQLELQIVPGIPAEDELLLSKFNRGSSYPGASLVLKVQSPTGPDPFCTADPCTPATH